MLIDLSEADFLSKVLENLKEGIWTTSQDVETILNSHRQSPTNDSVAVAYGALISLADRFTRNGFSKAALQVLELSEPLLYRLIQHCESISLEQIYILIEQLVELNHYDRARKVSKHCISLILKRCKHYPLQEKQTLEDELTETFFRPIAQHEAMATDLSGLIEKWTEFDFTFKFQPTQNAFHVTEETYRLIQFKDKENFDRLDAA